MITHNINPVLLELGPLEIRYYGLVYFLGFIFTYYFLNTQIKKGTLKLTEKQLESFIIYALIGMLIGSRLFTFLIYNPSLFIADPLIIFRIWEGGMAFHGSLTGIIISTIIFARKNKINFYELADLAVIPSALFLFLGRVANYINAEIPGIRSTVAWCVNFPGHEGCRHPYQIYEGLKNLGIFFTMLYLHIKKTLKPGIMFWGFILAYNSLRFFIDFLRDETRIIISIGQTLSLIYVALSIYFLYHLSKKYKGKILATK
ncbi:MAG: prolipoprotein diacylglyceryl transferase [Candidatus Woesearchaeota archaeon]